MFSRHNSFGDMPMHRPGFDHLAPSTPQPYGTSASGAMRESIGGKIDTTLVPYELTLMAAVGLNYGAEKYSARNFESGFTLAQLCCSIERHNKALMDGEIYDESSGLPHIALLASSIAMLSHNWMQHRILAPEHPPKVGYSIDRLSVAAKETLDARGKDAQR